MAGPGWVCQVSGALLPCRRVCRTAWALPPPPPATAPLDTLAPGSLVWKPLTSCFSAASSEPEVHQEKISSVPPFAAWLPPRDELSEPPQAATVKASVAASAHAV